jgi:hypothetical protein
MSRANPSGHPDDPLERYRLENEAREDEIARERRRREREQRRATEAAAEAEAASLRLAFEHRIAALEQADRETTEHLVNIAGCAANGVDLLTDRIIELDRELRAAIAKIDGIMSRLAERGGEAKFEFARDREKSDENKTVVDLPEFLPPRRVN